jgi:WD40-like Beta Propeller Repeat
VTFALLTLAVLPAAASADLFAITEVRGTNGDTDLARFDVGTGARQTLPASINTRGDELHPSLSPDGKRLAYESFTPGANTNRIVALDLGSGASADMINAFDTLSVKPNDPDWSDNSHVTIGQNTGETPPDARIGWCDRESGRSPRTPPCEERDQPETR